MEVNFWQSLNEPIIQRALISAAVIGIVCGVVGSFVVVRGMSFFGDALAHSVLPGTAAAYIYGGGAASIPIWSDFLRLFPDESVRLFVGGLIAGVFSALVIGLLTRDKRLKEDTAIGIIFVSMFALGIIIVSTDPRAYRSNLLHYLFGNIFALSQSQLMMTIIFAVLVIFVIFIFYKELMIISFDSDLARTLKLPGEALRLLLLVLIAVTIVASLRAVGVVLMVALLVIPAATAGLLVKRLHWMMFVACLLGVGGGLVGTYLSFEWSVPAGPAIVLVLTGFFIVAFSLTSIANLFSTRHR
ncbi:MAG: metal ABC transporter permease [Chloroflexi bacterium AL-W]|nr:metal ABC transporter permease [Chloroflexi bacterium AL-W]